jgi:hypothetical protein
VADASASSLVATIALAIEPGEEAVDLNPFPAKELALGRTFHAPTY